MPAGDSVTLRFTLTNLSVTDTVTDIAFDDDLDATLSGLSATGAILDTCGETPTFGGLFEYDGGSLMPGASCTNALDVAIPLGPFPGSVFPNTTTAVAGKVGTLDVSGNAASDDLRVNSLTFTKSFSSATIPGGTRTLTFTIENLDATGAAIDLAFSDDLSAVIPGLVATSLPTAPCGTGSALAGTSFLTLTGGNLWPGETCAFEVDVLVPGSATEGTFLNTSSDLVRNGLSVADAAMDRLIVAVCPFVPLELDNQTITGIQVFCASVATLGPNLIVDGASTMDLLVGASVTFLNGTQIGGSFSAGTDFFCPSGPPPTVTGSGDCDHTAAGHLG